MTSKYCECPWCKEISLSNTPEESTADSYIQEFYCANPGCGFMECRTNKEYEKKAQEREKQAAWWQAIDDDQAYIDQEVSRDAS